MSKADKTLSVSTAAAGEWCMKKIVKRAAVSSLCNRDKCKRTWGE